MQIMIAEYASQLMPKHAEEGIAMRDALCAGLRACGHVACIPDRSANDDAAFQRQVAHIARQCDAGIVVAPDHVLYELTTLVEANTLNLGCPPEAIKQAADKLTASRVLRAGGIRTPDTNPESGPYVVKPRYGCGSEDVHVVQRINADDVTENTFVSKFITGEHISVSLIVGQTILPLSINKQLVHIDDRVRYLGNVTPYPIQGSCGVLQQAIQAARVLGCSGYVGVDMVREDNGANTVIEVNARPTTAIVSINRIIGNVAKLVLSARLGHALPEFLMPRGKHTFLKRGALCGGSGV